MPKPFDHLLSIVHLEQDDSKTARSWKQKKLDKIYNSKHIAFFLKLERQRQITNSS